MNLLDNPATEIAWKIRDIQHCHQLCIQSVLARYDLHFGQPRILHVVMEMDGATQNEIAVRLGVSPASVAMSIKRMQKAGLLEKTGDEKDLRINQIRLTQKGHMVQKESLMEVISADKKMLNGFTEDEIRLFNGFLNRIYENLNNTEEADD
jgi:DNA-binding MarR family transcriptional regulator